ncbi:aldehyde dehydrogenase family protein [Pseudobdellovibrio exovorus]|uniref:Succinate-semialdehyde dehydrogenase (NADP+) n=1 Tax=Pseudobdellovibrio exovorus JSS TaxID=1184267 RepID=M4VC40_9BACT|nr:aldehyde dehydrogenase family protein [Pseudobdellovibrio exovorus]AGH95591.1 succinate-semialdehyde dehydrogenase (NADP+) [Pseudobdellovibrio exovorus JSS]
MSFETRSFWDGSVKDSYKYCSQDEILLSIESLHKGFQVWRQLSYEKRQQALVKLSERIEARQDELAQLITSEMGKPIQEARAEVLKSLDAVKKAIALDVSFLNERLEKSQYSQSRVQYMPLGIVYAIMPWNLPLWQVIRMVVPALIAGNVILLKHSEITPLTANLIEELFKDLIPNGPVLLNRFIRHDDTEFVLSQDFVGGVSLTGSVGAGKKVYEIAGRYLKKAVFELGGSDPYLVLDDADLPKAASLVAKGRLNNCGQTCISVKRVLVHENVLQEFLQLLKLQYDQIIFGDPSSEQTTLGPLAHVRFKESLKKQLQELELKTEAKLVYSRSHGQPQHSAFVDAGIYLLAKNSDWLRDQEIFAPILLVIPFKEDAEAVSIANATDFALGAGVFTSDLERAEALARQIHAGQVVINGLIGSDFFLPFGGFKKSGVGRELGREAFFEFTQTKVLARA